KEGIGRVERRSAGHGFRYSAVIGKSKRRQCRPLACNRAQSDDAEKQNCHRTEELRAAGHMTSFGREGSACSLWTSQARGETRQPCASNLALMADAAGEIESCIPAT